jgi:hypothetical protein
VSLVSGSPSQLVRIAEGKMKNRPVLTSLFLLATFVALDRPEVAHSQDTAVASRPSLEAERIPGKKSEGTATLLSFAGTVVPTTLGILLASTSENAMSDSGLAAVLFSYGVYFGPATGYWYAGASSPGWKGTGIRLGISLATVAAIGAICSGDNCNIFGDDDGATTAAGIVGLVGLGAIAYSMIHDIAAVGGPVRQHNAELAARHETSRLTIAPIVSPADGGTVGVLGRLQL